MAKRKPLDPHTLRMAAAYITRRQVWSVTSGDIWHLGLNAGIRAAARHLRTLATEQARALKPAKRTKR